MRANFLKYQKHQGSAWIIFCKAYLQLKEPFLHFIVLENAVIKFNLKYLWNERAPKIVTLKIEGSV